MRMSRQLRLIELHRRMGVGQRASLKTFRKFLKRERDKARKEGQLWATLIPLWEDMP